MKKLISILILLISIHSFGQDVVGSRVIAKQSLFVKDNWVDSLRRDTLNWANDNRTLPTTGAVYKFVVGRLGSGIPGLGTVTSVATTNGITGGTITGAGTLKLGGNITENTTLTGNDFDFKIIGAYTNDFNYGSSYLHFTGGENSFDSHVERNGRGANLNYYADASSGYFTGFTTNAAGNLYTSLSSTSSTHTYETGSVFNTGGRWIDSRSQMVLANNPALVHWDWWLEQWSGATTERFTNVNWGADSTGWWARTYRKSGVNNSALYKGIRVDTSSNVRFENYPSTRNDGTTTKALYIINSNGDIGYGDISGSSGGGNPCLAQDMVFRINDYGYPATGENTYTRTIFDGATHIDIWRGGQMLNPNDASFGFSVTDSVITFTPMFTGNEPMLIRVQPDSCFESVTQRPVLIILNGESLMAGWGLNDSATVTEQGTRRIKNLNGLTQAFEFEKIGITPGFVFNNYKGINLGGNETFARSHHALELGFANKYDSSYFDGRAVYINKCALGGTRILDWRRTASTHYYDTLMKYTQNSINAIVAETGMMPIVIFEWECAVNDQVAGMAAAAWQDTVSTFFSDVRAHFTTNFGVDTTYIQMFKLSSPSAYTGYNTRMDNLQAADATGNTMAISTAGATYTCEDGSCVTHWGYTGMRNVVVQNAMVKILEILARY